MDRRGADLPSLKVASMEGIARGGLDEARTWVLSNIVNTYLPLSGEAEARYRTLLRQEEHQMAKLLDYEAWREANLREGETRGEARGELRAKRRDIQTVLSTRFGSVPPEWTQQIDAMDSLPDLETLFVRLLTANGLEEVRDSLPR